MKKNLTILKTYIFQRRNVLFVRETGRRHDQTISKEDIQLLVSINIEYGVTGNKRKCRYEQ